MTPPTPPEPKPGEHDAVNIAMLRFAASMLEVRGFSNLAGMVRFSGDEITRLQARVAELEQKLDASEKNLQCWTADLQESLRVSEARVAELEKQLADRDMEYGPILDD